MIPTSRRSRVTNSKMATQGQKNGRRRQYVTWLLKALAWAGFGVIYYALFSFFVDTPTEYRMRHSTDRLRHEYKLLAERYDTLEMVVDNIIERDRSIFATLFESAPYDFTSEYEQHRVELRERLLDLSKQQLTRRLAHSVNAMEYKLTQLEHSYSALNDRLATTGEAINRIPSIQPVINHDLTLLTAAYGELMHPFSRTMKSHQGVDYAVPEGSPVFATADGTVREVSGKNRSTSGLKVVIDHGNGYRTSYAHLQKAKVKRGQRVHRGDIIALSGNTGLSLAPHLHYEVEYEGTRRNPIHYFFRELTPDAYQRIVRIAQSGMQSFD